MFSSASSPREIRKVTIQRDALTRSESDEIFVPPKAVVRLPGTPRDVDEQEEWADDTCLRTAAQQELGGYLAAPASLRVEPARQTTKHNAATEVLVRFSVPFARETCPSDAIVHRHLQEKQVETHQRFVRDGMRWIPSYSAQRIFDAVKCFEYRRQVSDAIERLSSNTKIATESTGKYLEDYQWTGGKKDVATWFHVYEPLSEEGIISFRASDATRYGIHKALILSVYQKRETGRFDRESRAYKKISAAELAKELPISDQSIGTHLREMVASGVFIKHPASPKYLHLVE